MMMSSFGPVVEKRVRISNLGACTTFQLITCIAASRAASGVVRQFITTFVTTS